VLNIKTFPVNPLEVNCYVLSDETRQAAVIDPGCFAESEWADILAYIRREGLHVSRCLLTHAHFDHVMGCHFVMRDLGLQPELWHEDAPLYRDLSGQVQQFFGPGMYIPGQPALGRCFTGETDITLGSHTLSLLHTPGHSPGCVCYYCPAEAVILTGDTLFRGSMGRTDLQGGDIAQMYASLSRLARLPAGVTALPGHGPQTTIQNEQRWIQPTYSR